MGNQPLFKRTAIASLTALYVGGAFTLALANPATQQAAGNNFYTPTFTAQDIKKINDARKKELGGDIYVGTPGQVNSVKKMRTPEEIFQPTDGAQGVQTYIVQLEAEPIATYGGGVQGFSATKAPKNRSMVAKGRVSINTTATQSYKNYLLNQQDSFVAKVRQAGASVKVNKQFTVASNALVVEMTQDDAIRMSQQAGVKRITPNRIFELRTDRGPEFIGADKLWQGTATAGLPAAKGEGMVVGIIDTGINTDHIAFADDSEYERLNPYKGQAIGDCAESPDLCNNKLVGLHSYPEITDTYDAPEFQTSGKPVMIRPANAEDYNGHGSHTASTVAGNSLKDTPLQGITGEATSDGVDVPFNFPQTSGVAPRAHIIAYQVCWPGNGGDPYTGCPESAILSAFEDAIADGVDAINFSIGGSESFPWADPMELAFLSAREAGISVAAAAGNSGAYWTADHASPWVTTVGATTHDRKLEAGIKTLDDFEGTSVPTAPIDGKSFSGSITGEVVLAENYADPDTSDTFNAASCNVPFPADTFTSDQIVICERGDIPRVDKAKNVAAGGAGGFILQNITSAADNIEADLYVIPGIQVKAANRSRLKNWVKHSNGAARATISDYTNTYSFDEKNGNNLAPFSSLGPSKTNNTLVPDLTAPGVDIYAANADDQPFTQAPSSSDWTFMSGTSMAAPHVTGAMTLLSQLHPEWTPAEIQSALMLTAGQVMLDTSSGRVEPFNHFMAGAGAINVARAAEIGLVMDETIENYRDADPSNGGIANWLNIPSMIEMECEKTCSWMRTVKATRDGSWSVEGVGKEEGFEVSVEPAQFTLKAGQSQAIIVTVKTPGFIEQMVNPEDAAGQWSQIINKDTFFNGQLNLKEINGNAPDVHMPIVVASVADQLPVSHRFDITRDQGTESLIVNTDSYSQLTPRFYGPVKPDVRTVTMPAVSPFLYPEIIEKGWDIQKIVVPEGTKRLVIEALHAEQVTTDVNLVPRYTQPHPFVIVGRDKNGNETFIPTDEGKDDVYAIKAEYEDELICLSSSQAENNYCSIENPVPGTYWAATTMAYGEGDILIDTGVALVMENDDRGNLSISGPASHDGNGDYEIGINWDIPDTQAGDIYYSGFDLGNMPGAEGTLGFTALDIRRADDAVAFNVSQDTAKSMDVVDVTLKIAANLESQDRNYQFNLTLPEGMRLAPATIKTSSEAIASALVADEQSLRLSGLQTSTRDIKREYKMSTNLTDEMCHTPLIDDKSTGGYIDLFSEFGLQPNADWFVGDSYTNFDVPIDWLFYKDGAKFEVYNQENGGYMRMHAVGAMQFHTGSWSMKFHRGPGFLKEAIAPFWRGTFETQYRRNPSDPWGLTIATQYAEERPDLGDLLFLEFDNVTDTATGDTYDFQTILRSGIDNHQGKYEIIYAYDNLGDNLSKGAIFVEGFDSAWSATSGPKDGSIYSVLGFDNLDKVLSDDLVVCYDYIGPEQSEIEISFKAAITPAATGTDMNVQLDYEMDGQEAQSQSHSISVNSNIKLAPIADQVVAENQRLEGLNVSYVDANKVANTVEVTGEHIRAEVNGNSFTLIPDANYHGDTLVTVTVRDNEYTSDAASTRFTLTVKSDGVEPAPVVPETPVESDSNSSSGGGLGFGLLSLLALAGLRRRVKK